MPRLRKPRLIHKDFRVMKTSVSDLAPGNRHMNRKSLLLFILFAAGFIATSIAMPGIGRAQEDDRVAKSMELLMAMTAKLGPPKLEGTDPVGGTEAPALYFGTTRVNNTFTIVDEIGKEDGNGMTATLFAKAGDEYVRVSTSVPKPDGSRAMGTLLEGPALDSLRTGKAFYGQVPILGRPYITGYEPIRDETGAQIGIYYVGYFACWYCQR